MGLLLGGHGSGKSLLLQVFARQLRQRGCRLALVNLQGLEPLDLLGQIAVQLGANPGRGDTLSGLWRRLGDRVVELRYEDQQAVVLLDDAHAAADRVLSATLRLVQLARTTGAALTLVLSSADGAAASLPGSAEALLDLAALRIDLDPWEANDTAEYLRTALEKAGCRVDLFAPSAVERLHELGMGVPRRISQLADLALLAAAGQELSQLDGDTVDSVHRALAVV